MLAPSQKLMDRFPLDPNKLCKESVLILVSFALSQQAAKKIQIWLLFWKEMAFQDLSGFFFFFFKYTTELFLKNSATLWSVLGMAYRFGSSVNSEFGLSVWFERLKLMKMMYKLSLDVMITPESVSVSKVHHLIPKNVVSVTWGPHYAQHLVFSLIIKK